ncbi:hypothetical protein JZO77_07845 [Enterococcus hulanensis]|uniref:hypothetical protein n=1 Tax=Enterococcus hulanensis TaxID=2559929 RepID=UPI001A8CAAF8|nr:hypothetical protein [Enterococcus hulanensis]MBO0456644.1 hypothetical protein [Enterococcus hulanensis]
MKGFFLDNIAIWISLLGLFISVLNYFRDLIKIKLYISPLTNIKDVKTMDNKLVFPEDSVGMCFELKFLNTSKYQVGYFDLVFKDAKTNECLPVFDQMGLPSDLQRERYMALTLTEETPIINIMNGNEGIIPPYSFKRFETIVFPKSQQITVDVKYAKFSIIPNMKARHNKFCKHKTYTLYIEKDRLEKCKYNHSDQ